MSDVAIWKSIRLFIQSLKQEYIRLYGNKPKVESAPNFDFENRTISVIDLIQNSADTLSKPCTECIWYKPCLGGRASVCMNPAEGTYRHERVVGDILGVLDVDLCRNSKSKITAHGITCGIEGVFFQSKIQNFEVAQPTMYSWDADYKEDSSIPEDKGGYNYDSAIQSNI